MPSAIDSIIGNNLKVHWKLNRRDREVGKGSVSFWSAKVKGTEVNLNGRWSLHALLL